MIKTFRPSPEKKKKGSEILFKQGQGPTVCDLELIV